MSYLWAGVIHIKRVKRMGMGEMLSSAVKARVKIECMSLLTYLHSPSTVTSSAAALAKLKDS